MTLHAWVPCKTLTSRHDLLPLPASSPHPVKVPEGRSLLAITERTEPRLAQPQLTPRQHPEHGRARRPSEALKSFTLPTARAPPVTSGPTSWAAPAAGSPAPASAVSRASVKSHLPQPRPSSAWHAPFLSPAPLNHLWAQSWLLHSSSEEEGSLALSQAPAGWVSMKRNCRKAP